MKKNKIFKMCIVSMLLFMISLNGVKADDSCKTYTNYYFFARMNSVTAVNTQFENSTGDTFVENFGTYLETLPSGDTVIRKDRVCLQKGDVVDGSDCFETMK